ncbi:nuclear transport factor 2 family protein [Amycolatopsis sp., V23-08]|uniref:Nuclear transport factor 2 family protein n=1 Tax=Amycolatopsis heterodermiae TaxID=3110235 RepID=A0ABU5R4T2_9PSEU|nr:nuclear transport factor 2 family protein [Amycolatopsis sp., V23-08]MEA5361211.1 nuclear transport factor 2 family protein [Amycolatopsis sp., V23-08]
MTPRALIEGRVAAVAAKDLDALLACYAEDVTLFDAVGPLRDAGREAERTRLREWFGAYRSAIELEIRDLEVVANGDVAFASYLFHVRGTMLDGTDVAMWVRSTTGLRRGADGWKIVHEHSSVPFDGATGEALTRLRPGSGTAAG